MLQNFRNRSINQFFVDLCDFSTQRYLSITQYSLHVTKCCANPVWYFKHHQRSGL